VDAPGGVRAVSMLAEEDQALEAFLLDADGCALVLRDTEAVPDKSNDELFKAPGTPVRPKPSMLATKELYEQAKKEKPAPPEAKVQEAALMELYKTSLPLIENNNGVGLADAITNAYPNLGCLECRGEKSVICQSAIFFQLCPSNTVAEDLAQKISADRPKFFATEYDPTAIVDGKERGVIKSVQLLKGRVKHDGVNAAPHYRNVKALLTALKKVPGLYQKEVNKKQQETNQRLASGQKTLSDRLERMEGDFYALEPPDQIALEPPDQIALCDLDPSDSE